MRTVKLVIDAAHGSCRSRVQDTPIPQSIPCQLSRFLRAVSTILFPPCPTRTFLI